MYEVKLLKVNKKTELWNYEASSAENVDILYEVKPKSPKLIRIVVGRQTISPINNIWNNSIVRVVHETGIPESCVNKFLDSLDFLSRTIFLKFFSISKKFIQESHQVIKQRKSSNNIQMKIIYCIL